MTAKKEIKLIRSINNLNPRHHRTDMTRQQAYALMVECVKEVNLKTKTFLSECKITLIGRK